MTDSKLRALLEADPDAAAQVIRAVKDRLVVPHAKQVPIIGSDARFRVVRAGRRFGKTKISAHEIVKAAITEPGSMNWWVSNRWKNTRRGYRNVVKQIPPELLAKPAPMDTSPELILRFKNQSSIEFYSGESPDSMAGEGVDFVVVDEAALIRDAAWHQLIRPTLMDSGGRALIISTPRGRNWFYDIWHRGDDPGEDNYDAWHFTSYDNPYLQQDDIAEAKRTLPHLIYMQEIEAEFIDNAASIFTLGDGAVVPDLVDPRGQVVVGIDLADKNDFTVITGARAEDRRPCLHHRFNEIGWASQRQYIMAALRSVQENPAVEAVIVLMDVGGPGDVVFEDLQMAGFDIIPINFTNWKEKAVKLLASDLGQGQAHILEEQLPEFQHYEYEITPAGRYKFEASQGHDDEVSAKLLEHWGIVHHGAPSFTILDATPATEQAARLGHVEEGPIEPDPVQELMNRPGVWS